MDKPLISVVVPIYMIERYIGTCIESIINQTYKNLEIILVDDGGKDKCPQICDLYAKKDNRIKVIHKENGGLVSARKAGLFASTGEFISYVDGDDWIGPGFIEGLYTSVLTTGADMVCAGFTRDLFDKSAFFLNSVPIGVYEKENLEELWKRMISNGSYYRTGISTYVWNKLFKREILLDSQLAVDDRISIGEDGAVTYPVLLKCKKVVVTDNVAYHYRQREDSMLKQSTGYSGEAQKLKYLYEYMTGWAEKTDSKLGIKSQVVDYVLSIALMRSGGRLAHHDYSIFDDSYYGKEIVVYSAGTFGQQLMNRFRETEHCVIAGWIDDDYWEYRRCCLDVDPVESITSISYDYVLIATVDSIVAKNVIKKLADFGVSKTKILTVGEPKDKDKLIEQFLDVDTIKREEDNTITEVTVDA